MNSIEHLSIFLNKLRNNEPFAIIRPSYEEFQIMTDNHNTNYCLKQDLLNITNYIGIKNLYIGIPCKGCNEQIYNYYLQTLNLYNNNHLTYDNLFNNNNFTEFLSYIKNTPFYYIGPELALLEEKIPELPVIDNFLISSLYLPDKWDNLKDIFTRALITWVGIIDKSENNKNLIFLFSVGSITKILIPLLFKLYPKHTFIDITNVDITNVDITNVDITNVDNNTICDFNKGHENSSYSYSCSLYSLISNDDLNLFKGGWSYTFSEMSDLFKSLKYSPKDTKKESCSATCCAELSSFRSPFLDLQAFPSEKMGKESFSSGKEKFSILEFGGGDSSIPLYNILSRFYEVEYDIYENNTDFSIKDERLNTTIYDSENIENINIHNKKYDLILIDGPNGSSRFIWYYKIRKCIKENTIILIDDFVVYTIAQTELDRVFDYNILSKSDIPLVPYGEHSWRIINNIKLKEIDNPNDITVILNGVSPNNYLQLEAIKTQTRKPKQIFIWNDSNDSNDSSNNIPEEVKNDPSITIINYNKNIGAWAKFSIALLANTPYICIFDENIIPGKKWIENCIESMGKVNGLLGTTGLVFKKEYGYEIDSPKIGSESLNETIQQVDTVSDCFFFKKEWLHHLWSSNPNHNLFFESGENIAFSWALQKIGINTYVPPHPKQDQEMYGSINKINKINIGISNVPNHDYALKYFMNKGFKKLKDFSNFCSEYDNFKYYHNDPIFHESIIKGTCEPYSGSYNIVNKYISMFPHKNRTFIDIGSHIGTTVMPFLKLYNNCIAYEPQPENNKFLSKNVSDNNMSNRVIISNSCIGDKTSKGQMIYHEGNNSGCYYFKESINITNITNVTNITNIKINSIRLDDDPNVSSRDNIDFIKIDTEGFELNVLKGAEQTIIRNKPLIEIEVNGLSEKHYGINSEIIFNYLYSLGAVLFESDINLNGTVYFYFPNDTLSIESKKIFCFWTGTNQLTENRKECLKTIESNGDSFSSGKENYTLVTEENLDKYILKSHPLHEAYKYLSETHKADYLRTYFMHFYGGGYTDIKRQTGTWSTSFDKLLENKDMYAVGYTEIGQNGVSHISDGYYKPYWKELIGNGCYIFRPNTPFTKKWYENMISILDQNLELLKENPARHPRDCIEHFGWTSYPIKWSQILGDVFHPICYEYKDKLLHGLPMPLFYDYL